MSFQTDFINRQSMIRKSENELPTYLRSNYVFHPSYGNQLECTSSESNGKRHYTIPGGIRLPSVTTFLSESQSEAKKKALEEWVKRVGKKQADKIKKKAADRGSKLHALCEAYMLNSPIDQKAYQESLLFKQLYPELQHINNIHAIEAPLFSKKLGIAGRVDLIAEYKNILSVIDFKTSTNEKDITDIDDYLDQETAYALMYGEMSGYRVKQIVTLMTIDTPGNKDCRVFVESPSKYVERLLKRLGQYHRKNADLQKAFGKKWMGK